MPNKRKDKMTAGLDNLILVMSAFQNRLEEGTVPVLVTDSTSELCGVVNCGFLLIDPQPGDEMQEQQVVFVIQTDGSPPINNLLSLDNLEELAG